MQKKLCKNIYKLKSLFKVLFRLYLFQAYALNAKDEHFPNKKKSLPPGKKEKKKNKKQGNMSGKAPQNRNHETTMLNYGLFLLTVWPLKNKIQRLSTICS